MNLHRLRPGCIPGFLSVKNLFLPLALTSGLILILAGRANGQTFMTLHSFSGQHSDGAWPEAGLILSGNTLYGTTYWEVFSWGGAARGSVFKVCTDGTGFTNLYSFTETAANRDGIGPEAGLILTGNRLYGTAALGGSSGNGTVFAVNTDGTGFSSLHSFTGLSYPFSDTNSDGASPEAGLIVSINTLYGTAYGGGSFGHGTVFALNTDGTAFTNLHSFAGYPNEGHGPRARLILSGNTLYGTTFGGGSSGNGTVFAVNTDGTGFANLHSFTGGSDGGWLYGGLILSGHTLYGTARIGGASHNGTVFAVNIDGTGFRNLHTFTALSSSFPDTNSDGACPQAELILSGDTLYGTASAGGSTGNGTVFAVNTNGTGFTNLYSFTALSPLYLGTNSDGAAPWAGLVLSGNTLYGTAYAGGSSDNGTVFSISLPSPQLTLLSSGANVILTWPTNAAGFTLQSTTNLVSPAVWATNFAGPVVVNGQNTVTNPVSGTQQFFRLSQ